MNKAAKKYMLQLGAAAALYTASVPISIKLLQALGEASPWKYLIAFLPVLAGLLALVVILRYHNQQDELFRLIQFKATVSAFLISGFVFFTSGFMQNAGIPAIDIEWVFPTMIATWGLCIAFFSWRYGSSCLTYK